MNSVEKNYKFLWMGSLEKRKVTFSYIQDYVQPHDIACSRRYLLPSDYLRILLNKKETEKADGHRQRRNWREKQSKHDELT